MSRQSSIIARNILITLVTQLVSWGLTFTVTLFLPRYIKDTGLGAITLVASIAGVLSVLVGLGTTTILIKEIARDPSCLGSLIVAGIATRLPLGVAALGIAWCAAQLLHYNSSVQALILLSVTGMAIGQVADVLYSALRGVEDFPRQNAIALLEKGLYSISILALIFLHGPLWAIVGVSIVTGTVAVIFSLAAVIRYAHRADLPLRWHFDVTQVRFLVVSGLPFLTSAIFTAIYGQSDAILLSKMSSFAATGWYGLATRLAGSTLIIPTTLTTTMLPMMVRVFREDYEKFVRVVQRLLNLMILSVIPFAAILILAPGQILHILHYPPSFRPAIPVLMVMGGGIVFWFLSQAAGTALIACDRQYVFAKVTGIAALVSIPMCAAGIYAADKFFGNGAVGALASDVLLEAGMVTAYICCLPKGIFTRAIVGILVRTSIAALPMVGLFLVSHNRFDLYLPCIGLLLYLPLCLLMRCIDPKDVELVRGMLKKESRAC